MDNCDPWDEDAELDAELVEKAVQMASWQTRSWPVPPAHHGDLQKAADDESARLCEVATDMDAQNEARQQNRLGQFMISAEDFHKYRHALVTAFGDLPKQLPVNSEGLMVIGAASPLFDPLGPDERAPVYDLHIDEDHREITVSVRRQDADQDCDWNCLRVKKPPEERPHITCNWKPSRPALR